jgi:hypothetical protein
VGEPIAGRARSRDGGGQQQAPTAIAASQKKTDENDAELLAPLGRVDPKLLAPLAHRKEETQADHLVFENSIERIFS